MPPTDDSPLAAALTWLALADAQNGQASWDEASVLFKRAIQPDQWSAALRAAREPLGALVSRSVKNETRATQLPGAPDGEYAVLQFESSFEKKKQAVETVTPMRDVDATWRVSGYFIR